jgi:NAD(P)-dependent dehydrogenase (short-subunit alcohol dehydrogenase family)
MSKVCFITDAGRGMGVNIAKAALADRKLGTITGNMKEIRR